MSFACTIPGCKTVAKTEAGLKKHMESAHAERAPDEVLIDGRKRIKTVQDEFTSIYPYLGLHFFTPEEMSRSQEGKTIQPLHGDKTLASVRATADGGNADFRLTGRMYVATLESGFREKFGLLVQVCYQKEGKSYYASGKSDEISLNDINRRSQEQGYSPWSYATWRK